MSITLADLRARVLQLAEELEAAALDFEVAGRAVSEAIPGEHEEGPSWALRAAELRLATERAARAAEAVRVVAAIYELLSWLSDKLEPDELPSGVPLDRPAPPERPRPSEGKLTRAGP